MSKISGFEVIIAQTNWHIDISLYDNVIAKLNAKIIKFKKIKELITIIKESPYMQQLVFVDESKANLNQFDKLFSTTVFVILSNEHKFDERTHILYMSQKSWQSYCDKILENGYDLELFSSSSIRNHVRYHNALYNGSNHQEAVGRLLLNPVNELDFENIKLIIRHYKVNLNLVPLEACTIVQRLFMHYIKINNKYELSNLQLNNVDKRLEILKFFIDNGADINLINSNGQTILHIAALIGDINADTYLKLVKLGANEELKNYEGKTPLDLVKLDARKTILQHKALSQFDFKCNLALLSEEQNEILNDLINSRELNNSPQDQQQLDRFNAAHLCRSSNKAQLILPDFVTKTLHYLADDDSPLSAKLQDYIWQKLLGNNTTDN